jgi:uncharacterized protein (TIGR03663 family)
MPFSEIKPWQRYLVFTLFVVGITSRLWVLGEKAFHHDESIHCFYSYKLATDGRQGPGGNATFGYDPVYHGPFLYHWGALVFFLFGDSDFTARLPYALAGIFLLWLVWETRKLVGVPMAIGMLAAVVLSPLANYYSRFARHDVYGYTAFFAVALYAALYLKEKKTRYLLLSAFFLAIGYSNKEDSYLHGFSLGVFALGWAAARIFLHGKSELGFWLRRSYPFVVLLTLYGCFSFFTFLFVALDYRIDPDEHGFVGGVVQILENAFVSEKLSASESGPELRKKIQAQKRFFTAQTERNAAGGVTEPGREWAKSFYIGFAFLFTLGVLALLEFLRHIYSRKDGSKSDDEPSGPDNIILPLAFGTALLILITALLGISLSSGLMAFLAAVVLWIAFEALRGDYLSLAVDDPKSPKILRIVSPWLAVASGLLIVLMVYFFLFSQMFGDLEESSKFGGRNGLERGLYDYIEYWFGHQLGEYRLWGPWWFYIARLLIYEYAFLLISAFGLVASVAWLVSEILFPAKEGKKNWGPFHPFFGLIVWTAVFNTALYAQLHEKAPWLAFHQAVPWALVAGGLLGWALTAWPYRWLRIALVFTVGPLVLLTAKAHIQVNFIEPDSVNELVSQQQADRDIRDMVEMVDRLAAETGQYEKFTIASEDEVEWPFPWYFRRYENYKVKTADPNAMIQFGDDSTFQEMRAKLGDKYVWRKYLHRGAWIENSMGSGELPGGESLWGNIKAYIEDTKFKGKSFRLLFNNYFFFRERWSDINPKWGYAYYRKEMMPTLEPIEVPDGSLDPPRPLAAEQTLANAVGNEKRFALPRQMRLDPQGNLHLVDSLNGRVVVTDPAGNFVRQYASPGTGEGQVKVEGTWGPSAVAIDASGYCYLTDTWNNRILRFDPEGKYLSGWGNGDAHTPKTTKFFYPRGIEVGPDGLIYVADTGDAEIEVFQPDGKLVRTIGKKGLKQGEFDEPVGLRFGPDGNLYVADTGNERIQILTPNGAPRDTIKVPGWSPNESEKVAMEPSLDILPDGRPVVTISRKNMIRVYAKDGESAQNYKIGAGKTEPLGIVALPDGKVWISDRTANQLYRAQIP